MSRIYEMMYLLDNDAVRVGWTEAKATVAGLMEKHGGKVLASRRWDERKLAYPIQRRSRGTYLLTHAEMPPEGVTPLRRELDLADSVLRYLILSVDQVPPKELELTQAESEADFVVPAPPEEGAAEVEEPQAEDAKPKPEAAKPEEPKAEEPKAEEPKAEEPKAEEPKAEEPKAEPKAEVAKAEEPKAEEGGVDAVDKKDGAVVAKEEN
jgi:ribosomal protein S6